MLCVIVYVCCIARSFISCKPVFCAFVCIPLSIAMHDQIFVVSVFVILYICAHLCCVVCV